MSRYERMWLMVALLFFKLGAEDLDFQVVTCIVLAG